MTDNNNPKSKTAYSKCGSILAKSAMMLLIGFCGGFLSWAFIAWARPIWANEALDGISTANTYIVFTSFIFVAFTVFLAIAGFVFTQQFSQNREMHISDALDHIKNTIIKDERTATSLVTAILESPDGKRFLKEMLESKVQELIQERSRSLAQQAQVAERLAGDTPNSSSGRTPWAQDSTPRGPNGAHPNG